MGGETAEEVKQETWSLGQDFVGSYPAERRNRVVDTFWLLLPVWRVWPCNATDDLWALGSDYTHNPNPGRRHAVKGKKKWREPQRDDGWRRMHASSRFKSSRVQLESSRLASFENCASSFPSNPGNSSATYPTLDNRQQKRINRASRNVFTWSTSQTGA